MKYSYIQVLYAAVLLSTPSLECLGAGSTFSLSHNLPLVATVSVNDVAYLFLVDTASGYSVIDSGLAAQLHLTEQGELDQRFPHMTDWRGAPNMQINDCTLPLSRVGVRDLSSMRFGSGRPIFGVIGVDAIKGFVLELDFEQSTWGLLSERSARFAQCLANPVSIARDGCPCITAQLGNKELQVVIDTGSNQSVTVPGKMFNQLLAERAIVRLHDRSELQGFGGIRTRLSGRGVGFVLSDHSVDDIVVTQAGEGVSRNYIGMNTLCRYHLSLDVSNKTICLIPNAFSKGRDVSDLDEMSIARGDDSLVVDSVRRNGRAWRFGVRPGDELISFDGKLVKDIGFIQALVLLTRPRVEKIKVGLRRMSTVVQMEFSP